MVMFSAAWDTRHIMSHRLTAAKNRLQSKTSANYWKSLNPNLTHLYLEQNGGASVDVSSIFLDKHILILREFLYVSVIGYRE